MTPEQCFKWGGTHRYALPPLLDNPGHFTFSFACELSAVKVAKLRQTDGHLCSQTTTTLLFMSSPWICSHLREGRGWKGDSHHRWQNKKSNSKCLTCKLHLKKKVLHPITGIMLTNKLLWSWLVLIKNPESTIFETKTDLECYNTTNQSVLWRFILTLKLH